MPADLDCLPNHALLSPMYEAFMREVAVGGASPVSYFDEAMPGFARPYQYRIQPWPILIRRALHRELGQIALRLVSLVHSIPALAFSDDYARLLNFYRPPTATYAEHAAPERRALDVAISRCDFVLTNEGPKLLEFNLGSDLGGWEIYLLEDTYRREPTFAAFAARLGLQTTCVSPLWSMITHCMNVGRRYLQGSDSCVNLAITLRPEQAERSRPLIEYLNGALARQAGGGRIFSYTNSSDISLSRSGLSIDGKFVHVVLNRTDIEVVPAIVHQAYRSGLVAMINTAASYLLSSKKSVALLSQLAETDALAQADRLLLRRHVPWTREITETLDFRGRHADALDVLEQYQDDLVLKPSRGYHGTDVLLGCKTARDEWIRACQHAQVRGGYVVQERCLSPDYIGLADGAPSPHQFVWGVFTYGQAFGGSWVRMLPTNHPAGVINSFRGASEAIVFEH